MITFNLKCLNDHTFEGWFNSNEDFEKQRSTGLLQCPVCGVGAVEKGLHAPSVVLKKEAPAAAPKKPPRPITREEAERALYKLSSFVCQNFEDVGEKFPEEARKIHYGETEKRGIYGQTTSEEEQDLKAEGIPIMKIPAPPKFEQ